MAGIIVIQLKKNAKPIIVSEIDKKMIEEEFIRLSDNPRVYYNKNTVQKSDLDKIFSFVKLVCKKDPIYDKILFSSSLSHFLGS